MIEHALIISLWCLGFRVLTDEGQLLFPLRLWGENQEGLLYYILKPILLCVTCYASFHGFLIHWFKWGIYPEMIVTLMMSVFINAFGWSTICKLWK